MQKTLSPVFAEYAIVSLVSVLLLIGATGCSQSLASKSDTVKAVAKPLQTVVVARPVELPIVEWDEFVGRLEPVETVQVRSRVSGYLASTNFEEGQLVQSGDVLAVVDQRPFQSEVSRSRANLADAKAQLAQAKALVAQAQADAQRANIHRDLIKKQLDRARLLVEQRAATLQGYEISEAEFAEAEADIVVAESRIESARSAVVAAEATISISEANLQLAELNLTYTEIRSPINGRISSRYVTEGNLVSGGTNDATLLTTIVSLDPIHCYFDADEQTFLKYSQLARSGKRPDNRELFNPVFVALSNERDGFPHQGYIDFIDNRIDEMTGTIRGRAILPNKELELTPGLFARVRLPGSPRYNAILVPDKAIGTDQAEKFVFTIDGNAKVVRKVVSLGPMSHGLRIIRSGLAPEDMVVLSGQQRARPGMEVIVKTETITPGDEVLPDNYEPVSPDMLLSTKRATAGNVEVPTTAEPSRAEPNSHGIPARTARTQP